jgi:hypothetical protein
MRGANEKTACFGFAVRCGAAGVPGGGQAGGRGAPGVGARSSSPAAGLRCQVQAGEARGDLVRRKGVRAAFGHVGATLALAALLGCGSVTADPGPDAAVSGVGDVAGAAGGGAAAGAGSPGGLGTGGSSATGGAAGAASGAGGAAGAGCLPYDSPGFAYGNGCDGGTSLPTACHAACELDSAKFVGCADDPRVPQGAVICHASCAECS